MPTPNLTNIYYTTTERLSDPKIVFPAVAKILKTAGYPRHARELRHRQYDKYESPQHIQNTLSQYVKVVLCQDDVTADAYNAEIALTKTVY